QIYCTGELLKQVQAAKLFEDDKHFVDMALKASPVNATPGGTLTKQQLAEFVETYFSPPGQELENWVPLDWTDSPPLLEKISDEKLRSWARALNNKWKQLGRKMKPEVQTSPERHSLIYVPNPLIVPGGRFIEYYYWWARCWAQGPCMCGFLLGHRRPFALQHDRHGRGHDQELPSSGGEVSILLVLGGGRLARSGQTSLILSPSHPTPATLLRLPVLLLLGDRLGHIPNGGRVYYARRSQPPLLSLMVESYLRHTNNTDLLR
ncbi:hypothetical protein JD844_031657, partial [Phrynosoma platyrhinos]